MRSAISAETVLVRRVVWPFVVRPARGAPAGACEALGIGDLRVTEDGVSRRVTAVSPRPARALHAVLLDASLSMRTHDRLDHARDAATRYVRGLPEREPALVAAFDDSLRLVLPPTLDRERAALAIESIRPGNGTALWDALHELLGYLESWPGTKTLVLLTDGEDSTSLLPAGRHGVLEQARGAPDVAVFPLALDLSSTARSDGYRALLRELADSTGGLFFEARGVAVLDATFDALRAHLARRWFVSYEPLPNGTLAEDRGSLLRSRRVRVRLAPGLPCRVEALGRRERTEDDAPERPLWEPVSQRVEGEFELRRGARYAWAPDLEPPSARSAGGGSLEIRTPDVVRERGVLWRRGPWERAGKLSTTVDRTPEVALRELEVELPPLEIVRREIDSPEAVLVRLLRDPDRAVTPFVNGRALLELRAPIARTLFELHEDYRAFARERLVEDALPEIDSALAELGRREPPLDREVLEGVRAALLAHAVDPERAAPARFLAEWLGDVSARDAAARLEARLASAVLAPAAPAALRELATALAGSGWRRVRELLPPATAVRIVAPLVPAWDAERRAVGFYRFVLSRPALDPHALDGPPEEPLPERPLGLEALTALVRSKGAATFEGLHVSRIEHLARGTPRRREHVRALRAALEPGSGKPDVEAVAIVELSDVEAPGGTLRLVVARVREGSAPLLAAACIDGRASPALERARGAIEPRTGTGTGECGF